MRYLGFFLAVAGGVLGLLIGLFLNGSVFSIIAQAVGQHPHHVLAVITWVASIVGVAGGVAMLFLPKLGAAMTIVASVIGVFGSLGLWVLAGSFFFSAAMVGLYKDTAEKVVPSN